MQAFTRTMYTYVVSAVESGRRKANFPTGMLAHAHFGAMKAQRKARARLNPLIMPLITRSGKGGTLRAVFPQKITKGKARAKRKTKCRGI